MSEKYGFEENEVCGRDGCDGTIQLEDTDSCCSCHISPPCSHCVDDRHYCPKCDWHAIDDQKNTYSYSSAPTYPVYQYKTNVQKLAEMDHSKIDWVWESHTHFSMKKIGKCPLNATTKEVFEHVKGTFGGRFERFNEGHFTFIAYTD